jgi:hypothetical protein
VLQIFLYTLVYLVLPYSHSILEVSRYKQGTRVSTEIAKGILNAFGGGTVGVFLKKILAGADPIFF